MGVNITNKERYICNECGEFTEIVKDVCVGRVSKCHGVGFMYENKKGKLIEINKYLRYLSEWNEI